MSRAYFDWIFSQVELIFPDHVKEGGAWSGETEFLAITRFLCTMPFTGEIPLRFNL